MESSSASILVTDLVPGWDEEIRPRLVTPPDEFEVRPPVTIVEAVERTEPAAQPRPERRSAYNLLEPVEPEVPAAAPVDDPAGELAALPTRDIARELLRAKLIDLAQVRERRSAYEIVFILLAGAVAVLLAAPPLVQVLLAAHGVQA